MGIKDMFRKPRAESPTVCWEETEKMQAELLKKQAAIDLERLTRQQQEREWEWKFWNLQRAVNSLVLRLKVLDINQLAKEQGEDGTVPLRLAISELKKLIEAYDERSLPETGYAQTQTWIDSTCTPIRYFNTTPSTPVIYTTSSTTSSQERE